MNQLLSKIIPFLVICLFTFVPFVSFAAGQLQSSPARGGGNSEYKPITPGGETFFESSTFEGMVQKIFELTIYFTVILAVIMIIAGGVEYMGSESMFKKGEGKARIFAAISGLLIALVSILVISTLLPGGNGNTFEINIFND